MMTKAHLKLAGDPGDAKLQTRTPEREALAQAIKTRDHAQELVNAIRSAQETALTAARAARDTLEAAEANVEVAKRETARHLVDSALGKEGSPPTTVQAARAAVQNAKDDLDAALVAQAELEKQLKSAEMKLAFARDGVTRAVQAAVSSDRTVHKMLSDFAALSKQLVSLRLSLQFLDGKSCLPPEAWGFDAQRSFPDLIWGEPWQAVLAALASDPDVALPS